MKTYNEIDYKLNTLSMINEPTTEYKFNDSDIEILQLDENAFDEYILKQLK